MGRWSADRLAYAWMRPAVARDDRRKSGLPLRSDWIARAAGAAEIRAAVLQLRRFVPVQPSQAQRWTLFQVTRLEGDDERLNEAARAVMAPGPHPSAPLWRSVAAGVLAGSTR